MHANSLTLETARDHEANLLNLAAAVKVLPPQPSTRRRKRVWILRRLRLHALKAAVDGGP
jgi:hypothetical protein